MSDQPDSQPTLREQCFEGIESLRQHVGDPSPWSRRDIPPIVAYIQSLEEQIAALTAPAPAADAPADGSTDTAATASKKK